MINVSAIRKQLSAEVGSKTHGIALGAASQLQTAIAKVITDRDTLSKSPRGIRDTDREALDTRATLLLAQLVGVGALLSEHTMEVSVADIQLPGSRKAVTTARETAVASIAKLQDGIKTVQAQAQEAGITADDHAKLNGKETVLFAQLLGLTALIEACETQIATLDMLSTSLRGLTEKVPQMFGVRT